MAGPGSNASSEPRAALVAKLDNTDIASVMNSRCMAGSSALGADDETGVDATTGAAAGVEGAAVAAGAAHALMAPTPTAAPEIRTASAAHTPVRSVFDNLLEVNRVMPASSSRWLKPRPMTRLGRPTRR